MNHRALKLFGLVFSLILQLQLAACGTVGIATTNNSFPVVVFSDVHFDPFYDPSPSTFHALVAAEAVEWADIFKTSSIVAPSTWGNDTNFPLLQLSLSSVRQNLGTSPLVIFTGDILSHHFAQTFYTLNGSANPPSEADVAAMKAFSDKTVAFFAEQVRASVGNIPVVFAMGNNDSYADLGPDSAFLSNNAESFYTQFLSGSVDHQAFLTTFERGGYYSTEPPGTNLIVLGLNTIIFCPPPPGIDVESTVAAELAWFDSKLASARATGKKVWLLMHIPPGVNILSTAKSVDSNGHVTEAAMMWKPEYEASFLQILAKYWGTVTLKLAGHTHMDEYRVMSPHDVLQMTPSISPRSGNNPAFKVVTFSRTTLKPTDYTSLNYSLLAMPAQFNSYYTFSAVYTGDRSLDDSLAQLYPTLATDTTKQALYRAHYFSGHDYTDTFHPITDVNWPVFRCGVATMDQQGFMDCMNSH